METKEPVPIACQYCKSSLVAADATLCAVCRQPQHKALWGRALHWAPIAPLGSAIVSIFLLSLSVVQLFRTTESLRVANNAQQTAEAASVRLNNAQQTAETAAASVTGILRRLGTVEDVLTEVDVATSGRKLCLIYEPGTWADPTTGTLPLFVPAKFTAKACKEQAKLGPVGTKVRLGCVFANHASIGKHSNASTGTDLTIPEQNCGW